MFPPWLFHPAGFLNCGHTASTSFRVFTRSAAQRSDAYTNQTSGLSPSS